MGSKPLHSGAQKPQVRAQKKCEQVEKITGIKKPSETVTENTHFPQEQLLLIPGHTRSQTQTRYPKIPDLEKKNIAIQKNTIMILCISFKFSCNRNPKNAYKPEKTRTEKNPKLILEPKKTNETRWNRTLYPKIPGFRIFDSNQTRVL